jgi:hypothetical protein
MRKKITTVIKSRRMRWVGHLTCRGEVGISYKILFGKREGKRSLERFRRRWDENIIMDLRK